MSVPKCPDMATYTLKSSIVLFLSKEILEGSYPVYTG